MTRSEFKSNLPQKIEHSVHGTLELYISADNKYIKAACYKNKNIRMGYNQANNFHDLFYLMVDFLEGLD